jgi:hypothetical protein
MGHLGESFEAAIAKKIAAKEGRNPHVKQKVQNKKKEL